ncbi:alpha/beta hydrolase [Glycomyces tarimensis]
MTEYRTTTSRDGTSIAYQCRGSGPALILVGGALRSPVINEELVRRLAGDLTVVTFDRRGRGASGDTAPYAVNREVEDLTALIDMVGGNAALYGHSAGAGLALYAAARGLPVTGLVLHDPAFAPDDAARDRAAEEAAAHQELLTADRRADSLELFLASLGLPPEIIKPMSGDPELVAMAHTIGYDYQVLDDARNGRAAFAAEAATVTVPTLVLGTETAPDWMTEVGVGIARAFPNGHHRILAAHGMFPDPSEQATAMKRILTGQEIEDGDRCARTQNS